MTPYVGEGPRGSNGTCSTLSWILVPPSATPNQIGLLWCCFPSGWACAHSRPLWVSPGNSPVRLGVSPADTSTPTGVFNQRFEALFPPGWSPGLRGLLRSPAIPPGLSTCECGTVGSASGGVACPIHSTIHQSLCLALTTRVLSAPAARLHPSYRSG